MASPDFLWKTEGMLSNRVGTDHMDGRTILIGREGKYVRPWNHCIPFEALANDNLPPFHVRLRDDQVGHLARYARSSPRTIPVRKLGLWWSWDFDLVGKIIPTRTNWGPAHVGQCTDPSKASLRGGLPMLAYIDPCLPPTYTSSDKIMPQGTSELGISSLLKRKAMSDTKSEPNSDSKKPCLGSDNIKTMKAEEVKDSKLAAPKFETKPRLFVENCSAKEALAFYEILTSEVRRSQDRILALEKELESNSVQAEKDYDELHQKWTKCYDKKKEETEKLKVELEVSDKLLQSSNNTITEQYKQLAILNQTQRLLQEKEHEIKTQEEKLTRWEAQARAMLGGALPSINETATATITTTTKPTTNPKNDGSEGDKAPVKTSQPSSKTALPTTGGRAPVKTPLPSMLGTKALAKPNGIVNGKYTFTPQR